MPGDDVRKTMRPLADALARYDRTADYVGVLDEARALVRKAAETADELDAKYRAAMQISLPPVDSQTYNAVMEHAAILRGDIPSCVGCARLSTVHRTGCPNG